MNTFKILHTGDMHLGSPMLNMGEKAERRRAELNETFHNIIALAKSEEVDAVLIAGDMFEDGSPDAELMDFVNSEFEKISDIKVFIALGNHDYNLKNNFPSNVYVFNSHMEKVSLKNADIYGVSFASEHCETAVADGLEAEDTNKINILVMHAEVGNKGVYNPVSEYALQSSKMDYAALGHVHSHDSFVKLGNFTYSYCGIPEGRAFDETGTKGVIIAEISKEGTNGKFVPVCSREYCCVNVDVSGLDDNFEIANRVFQCLSDKVNAYRVTLTGERNTFIDTVFIKEFLEKEVYFTEVLDKTEEKADDGYTLKNLFMQKCDNANALKYGLAALRGEKVHIE